MVHWTLRKTVLSINKDLDSPLENEQFNTFKLLHDLKHSTSFRRPVIPVAKQYLWKSGQIGTPCFWWAILRAWGDFFLKPFWKSKLIRECSQPLHKLSTLSINANLTYSPWQLTFLIRCSFNGILICWNWFLSHLQCLRITLNFQMCYVHTVTKCWPKCTICFFTRSPHDMKGSATDEDFCQPPTKGLM